MSLKKVWIPLTLLFVSLVLRLSGSEGVALLEYQRESILDGEYWRLLSAHLVHGTWQHWLLNATGLSLVWAIFPRHFHQVSAGLLSLGIALSTSMALLILDSAVSWYLGMSALLHGLFVAFAIAERLNGRRIALIPLALVGMKLIYEQWFGPLPGSEESTGISVLVDAHLYGALSGGLLAVILFVYDKRFRRAA